MLSPKIIKPILSSPPILVFGIYLLCFILHIVIPEKYMSGYVYSSKTKEPLQYRNNAFKACEFIIDYLKVKAPFWKIEKLNNKKIFVKSKKSDEKKVKINI